MLQTNMGCNMTPIWSVLARYDSRDHSALLLMLDQARLSFDRYRLTSPHVSQRSLMQRLPMETKKVSPSRKRAWSLDSCAFAISSFADNGLSLWRPGNAHARAFSRVSTEIWTTEEGWLQLTHRYRHAQRCLRMSDSTPRFLPRQARPARFQGGVVASRRSEEVSQSRPAHSSGIPRHGHF
jgi:hypothetical protein